jgi:hypothetical protein
MIITNVNNIEHVGGGSCRCMLAEDWGTVKRKHLSVKALSLKGSLKDLRDRVRNNRLDHSTLDENSSH